MVVQTGTEPAKIKFIHLQIKLGLGQVKCTDQTLLESLLLPEQRASLTFEVNRSSMSWKIWGKKNQIIWGLNARLCKVGPVLAEGAVGTMSGRSALWEQQFLKHITEPTYPSGLECWFMDVADGTIRMTEDLHLLGLMALLEWLRKDYNFNICLATEWIQGQPDNLDCFKIEREKEAVDVAQRWSAWQVCGLPGAAKCPGIHTSAHVEDQRILHSFLHSFAPLFILSKHRSCLNSLVYNESSTTTKADRHDYASFSNHEREAG